MGQALRQTVADDRPVRDAALFGIHGGHVNVTDGHYVYMRAPKDDNQPLRSYTLQANRIRYLDRKPDLTLIEPFGFTKNMPVLAYETQGTPGATKPRAAEWGTLLYDLDSDPGQTTPITDIEAQMIAHLVREMTACEAPAEQNERLELAIS